MGTRSTQIPDGPSEYEAWSRVFNQVIREGLDAGFLVDFSATSVVPGEVDR